MVKIKIEELVKQLKPGEQLVYNKSFKWVAVTSQPYEGEHGKNHRIFKMENGEPEELDYKTIREQLVQEIMSKIDNDKLVKLILTESIDTTIPDEVFDLIERVVEKKGVVKQKKGCVELEVGGKRGKHMHFRIM